MNIANQLKQLEEQLLDPAVRRDPEQVALLLADDFIEFGSSGRVFNKSAILEDLQNEPPRMASLLSDFSTREIAPTAILTTWKATRRNLTGETIAQSWRSSLWILLDGRWQITFHQGTPIPGPPKPEASQPTQK
jgi:hypothetical protein